MAMRHRYRIGLFVGRFQPFHKGHMYALESALEMCNLLIIGIGGSQEEGTVNNPISSKNRIKIIRAALKGDSISLGRIRFLEIPDFNDNDKWFWYIMHKKPGIGVVFSRNRLVNSIFKGHGIATERPAWFRRATMRATRIRQKIINAREWQGSVPSGAVAQILSVEKQIRHAGVHRKGNGRVIIGGTFAYLHEGHRELIRRAFELGDEVYIGLTTDEYSARIKSRDTVPRYGQRKAELESFAGRLAKRLHIRPLSDRFGPSTTGDFDIIVVSRETLPTALEINRIRKRKKLRELKIVVIKNVLAKDGGAISTTRILKGDIDREGNML